MFLLLLLLAATISSQSPFHLSDFRESLLISPIVSDGKVFFLFNFTLLSPDASSHVELFSKRLLQIVQKHSVSDLELSFTQGRWRYENWGNRWGIATPSGAQVIATLAEPRAEIWKSLVHGLSGLFCASLNFLDLHTSSYASGIVYRDRDSFRGSLSKESVCTENLTPMKSLVPTKDGLVELLNPLKLFDSHFVSLALKYERRNLGHFMQFTTAVVFDMTDGNMDLVNVDFEGFFGKKLAGPSVIATESKIMVDTTNVVEMGVRNHLAITPKPSIEDGDRLVIYDLLKTDGRKQNNVKLFWKKKFSVLDMEFGSTSSKASSVTFTPIKVDKYHVYSDQIHGKIFLSFENMFKNEPLHISYQDTIPWFFQIYTHTFMLFKVNSKGEEIGGKFQEFTFIPYLGGKYMTILFNFTLPPQTVYRVVFDIENKLLPNEEHPPDASRGFDLSSSVVDYCYDSSPVTSDLSIEDNTVCRTYYSQSLLISIPIPDLSMPFNVMMISCTFISLFFGTLVSLAVKKYGWKAKFHMLKVLKRVVSKKTHSPFLLNDTFVNELFQEKNHEKLVALIKTYFEEESDWKNKRKFSGRWILKNYYKNGKGKGLKLFLLHLQKILKKIIKLVREKKQITIFGEYASAILSDVVPKIKEESSESILKSKAIKLVLGKVKNIVKSIRQTEIKNCVTRIRNEFDFL